jgi:hypothetical protein
MSTSPTDASLGIACPIPRHRLAYKSVTRHLTYTSDMDDEDTVLEEAMDNLKEAGQRIRATQSLEGMTDGENHCDRSCTPRSATSVRSLTGAVFLLGVLRPVGHRGACERLCLC